MAAQVQKATATAVNAASITTPAFASTTTAGNILYGLASVAYSLTSAPTFTFSDSKSNTWTTRATSNNFHNAANSAECSIGSATVTTAGTGTTVKVTAGTQTTGYQLVAVEWSGMTATTDGAAGTATGAPSSTNLTATTGATTNANDVLFMVFSGDTNTTSTGVTAPTVNASATGVTSILNTPATTFVAIDADYKILSGTGTQAVKWTYSADATGQYAGVAIAFQQTGGTTVALTGSTATFSAGTLAPSDAVALTGQTATFSAGSLTATPTLALTGLTATFSAGSLTPSNSLALSGLTATFTAGALAPTDTVALTGSTATFTAGTITASTSSGSTVALTGSTATFSAGNLSPATDTALSGLTATFSPGTLTPAPTVGLTGLSATFTAGSLTAATDTPLAGQTATFTAGTITAQTSGNVTVPLSGLTATFTAGQFTASGADTGLPPGGHGWIDEIYESNQRKTREILSIRKRWDEVERELAAAKVKETEEKARSKDIGVSIEALTFKVARVPPAKRLKLTAKIATKTEEKRTVDRSVERTQLKVQVLENHRAELKKRRETEELEVAEALVFLMTLED